MSSIAQRTFSDGVAQYFTLGNEEFVRQFNFKNGWNRIRIGVLHAIQGSTTFNDTNDGFGICKSSSPIQNTQGIKVWSSNLTTWWEGEATSGFGFGNVAYTYNAGPPAYYHTSLNALVWRNLVAGTAAAWSQNMYVAAAGSGCRSYMFLDAVKTPSSSAILFTYWLPQSVAQVQQDYTMADLKIGCSQVASGGLTLRGQALSALTPTNQGKPLESAGGEMDTFSIWWPLASPLKEIYGVCAFAMYY